MRDGARGGQALLPNEKGANRPFHQSRPPLWRAPGTPRFPARRRGRRALMGDCLGWPAPDGLLLLFLLPSQGSGGCPSAGAWSPRLLPTRPRSPSAANRGAGGGQALASVTIAWRERGGRGRESKAASLLEESLSLCLAGGEERLPSGTCKRSREGRTKEPAGASLGCAPFLGFAPLCRWPARARRELCFKQPR